MHALLQTEDLLHRAGQRSADVHHIQNLQRAGLQLHKVLVIATQRRGAHIVAAYVENDGVPIQNKSG